MRFEFHFDEKKLNGLKSKSIPIIESHSLFQNNKHYLIVICDLPETFYGENLDYDYNWVV